jgi:hypothetical protein
LDSVKSMAIRGEKYHVQGCFFGCCGFVWQAF